MAEKQDIAMNQFPIWSSMDYVYVERGNSQGKVHKSNFLSALVLGNKNERLIKKMFEYGYSKAAICRRLQCNPITLDRHLIRMCYFLPCN